MDSKYFPTRFHRKRAEKFVKKVKHAKQKVSQAASYKATTPGLLETSTDEKATQDLLLSEVDIGSATKRFELTFPGGPFLLDYSRNGRFLAYCGKRGTVAAFDWLTKKPLFEMNIKDECRDVKFLHQETFIAVAEPKCTCIYDNQGIEVHCLKQLDQILQLDFLPYHFLLVGSSETGFLHYLDCTVGSIVASIPTYMGRLNLMCSNPANGVIITGHNTGTVAMWVPSEKSAVVKMLTHYTGLSSIACDRSGRYLATCALDRKLKIWDMRSTYDPLSEITLPVPAGSMDYSQRGLLALGAGTTVQVLQDPHLGFTESSNGATGLPKQELVITNVHRRVVSNAYLSHYAIRPVHRVRFCPYEDVLGVSTTRGISSLLCPGSGEANFDALEENPFANKRYRQEREVKRLLDKIPHSMIAVDSIVGQVRREDILEEWEKRKAALLGQTPKVKMPEVKRNKQKGRSKPGRIEAKKQKIHFERKMFGIKNVLGIREERIRKQQEQPKNPDQTKTAKPSESWISRKELSKKRLKSALDVLIPSKD